MSRESASIDESQLARTASDGPRVSVVVNLFEGEKTIRATVESVLAQSFTDWEMLVWDDCSTDAGPRIVAEYRDPRIRLERAPTWTPLGRARDDAVRRARGEWIAFLDQDDLWTPDKLEKQLRRVEAEGRDDVALVYGRTLAFDERGFGREHPHQHEFAPLPEGEVFRLLFERSGFICMSSCLVRRDAYFDVGGITHQYQAVCDYQLFIAIAARHRVVAVQDVCCHYRVHANSMSRLQMDRIQLEILALVEEWAPRLDERLVARRRAVHSTLLAVVELRTRGHRRRGLRRLLSDGSLPYLATRPFVRIGRSVRRLVLGTYASRAERARTADAPIDRARATALRVAVGPTSCTTHSRAQLVDEVLRLLAAPPGPGRIVNCINPHIYNLAARDPQLRLWLADAAVTGADGLGIVWAARLLGHRIEQRCDMIDSFKAFLVDPRFRRTTAVLLGGYEGHAAVAAARIATDSPHCTVLHAVDGFRPDAYYAELLERSGPLDFVFVGMGTPKSERICALAARVRPEAIVWHIGGGTIEILAGKVDEPPEWVKVAGLQWLFRFAKHPRRLWRRYLIGHPRFVASVLRHVVAQRFLGGSAR